MKKEFGKIVNIKGEMPIEFQKTKKRKKQQQYIRWLDGINKIHGMSLKKLQIIT